MNHWWSDEPKDVRVVLDWIHDTADYVIPADCPELQAAVEAMRWVTDAADDPRRASDAYFDAHCPNSHDAALVIEEREQGEAVAWVERFLASGADLPTLTGQPA